MKKSGNKKGFTLVEIIVVLLVIGILLAITIPSIMGYVKKARNAEFITYARTVLVDTDASFIKNVNSSSKLEEASSIIKKEIEGKYLMTKNGDKEVFNGYKISKMYVYFDDYNSGIFSTSPGNTEMISDAYKFKTDYDSHFISKITIEFMKEGKVKEYKYAFVFSGEQIEILDKFNSNFFDINSKYFFPLS